MPRDKVDLVKRFLEAYNRRHVDGIFAEFVTPDFEWWPALRRAYEGGKPFGREGVERLAADASENVEVLQNVAEEFRDLGDSVLTLGRLKGRGASASSGVVRAAIAAQAKADEGGPSGSGGSSLARPRRPG
jgi:hypothetical protein